MPALPHKLSQQRTKAGPKRPCASRVLIRPLPEFDAWDDRRFWDKVRRRGSEACWPWTAALCAQGYGRFKLQGRLYGAHRIALYLSEPDKAALNRSLYALHSCDNPGCCNPAHLDWGTPRLNAQQASERGRLVRTPKRSPASLAGGLA